MLSLDARTATRDERRAMLWIRLPIGFVLLLGIAIALLTAMPAGKLFAGLIAWFTVPFLAYIFAYRTVVGSIITGAALLQLVVFSLPEALLELRDFYASGIQPPGGVFLLPFFLLMAVTVGLAIEMIVRAVARGRRRTN